MDKTMEWFAAGLEERGIILSSAQLSQFDAYFEMLVDWNERMNLTGITERDAVYEKHFFDSASLAFFINMKEVAKLADIGSGAGFPSLPLKICFPHLQIAIVDSLNKRVQFLAALTERLGLKDVQCIHGRAEDVARLSEHRDQYDLVTARAVACLSVLNEFCLPFVRQGGHFAAMKGAQSPEELKEAEFSLKELKGRIITEHELKLPHEQSERHIILIEKIEGTPKKYPRKAGTPLKQPLI